MGPGIGRVLDMQVLVFQLRVNPKPSKSDLSPTLCNKSHHPIEPLSSKVSVRLGMFCDRRHGV